jgi:comEA protein
MTKIKIIALILLALSVAMPASFTVASSNSKEVKSQVVMEKININSASEEQLRELPGVGPVTAAKILKYREANGNFSKVDELLQVKGIGAATLEKMKPYISI